MVNTITTADLAGKGVSGQPDVPGLSAAEMQYKVEEIQRAVIIPRLNQLITELQSAVDDSAAQWLGSPDIEGLSGANIQAKLVSIRDALNAKIGSTMLKGLRVNDLGQIEYTRDGTTWVLAQASSGGGEASIAVVTIPEGESIPVEDRYEHSLYLAIQNELNEVV